MHLQLGQMAATRSWRSVASSVATTGDDTIGSRRPEIAHILPKAVTVDATDTAPGLMAAHSGGLEAHGWLLRYAEVGAPGVAGEMWRRWVRR